MSKYSFIPMTMEREVAPDIVFRPIRSWHSGVYAGERLSQVNGDGSGCVKADGKCYPPQTVTHRIYWNKKTNKSISCFLSYPSAMGCVETYFWEIYPYENDVGRFFDEAEMEAVVIDLLKEPANV